jgi:putative flavoprotein involved in K+ transport
MHSNTTERRTGTVVIGGGQAGLVMAYYLKRDRQDFVVLEGDTRVGDVWRRRYDSLRLFSLPRYASLPGWRIPIDGFPTRLEMADYLEQYVARFELPVHTGVRVEQVRRDGDTFLVETNEGTYRTDRVVVATGGHQLATTPDFASELDPGIRQLHSVGYRNPGQFAPGGVLVVGAANSGTDVALDAAAAGHETWIAGRHPGQVPVDIGSRRGKVVVPIVMFVFKHVLTLRTPMGRKARAKAMHQGVMLVRNKLADLDAANVRRIGRITAIHDGRPVTDAGPVPEVGTVVWCTGSTPDHSFLEPSALGADGRPEQRRGVGAIPGLYYIGLEFQFALASGTIQGLDRDARYLMRQMGRVPKSAAKAGAERSLERVAS